MTAALSLLRGLRAQGFTLRIEGERLLVSPSKRLSPIQVEAIKRSKMELMEQLAWEAEEGPATKAILRAWYQEVENPPRRVGLFLLQGQEHNA